MYARYVHKFVHSGRRCGRVISVDRRICNNGCWNSDGHNMDSEIPTAVILKCMTVVERIMVVPLIGFSDVDS